VGANSVMKRLRVSVAICVLAIIKRSLEKYLKWAQRIRHHQLRHQVSSKVKGSGSSSTVLDTDLFS